MTLTKPEEATPIDALVGDMLERGVSEVRRPRCVSQQDFDNISTVIAKVVRMYHPVERYVPWQPAVQRGNRGTLMDYLREGDYRGAHGFLAAEAEFLPA